MGTGGNNTPMVAFPIQDGRDMEKHQNGHGIGEEGAPSYTLMTTGAQAVAYAFDSLSSNSMKSSNPNSGVRETEVAKTLDTARPDPSCNQGGIAIVFDDDRRVGPRIFDETIGTLQAFMGTGGNNTPMVAQPVETTMLSFDTQFGSNANVFEDQTPTLKASQAAPSVAYTLREREGKPGGGKGPLISEEKSGTLAARANDQTVFQPTQTTAFQPGTMIRMSGGVWDELAPTLRAEAKRGDNEPHVAIQYDGYNQKINDTDVSVTLRLGRDSSDFVAQSVVAPSLTASNDPSRSPQSAEITQQVTAVHEATMAVRRLTPVECERLMGWPDDWTDGQADTHRYKQCGNGVASPVAQWIAEQLLQLDKDNHATPQTGSTPTT